MHANTPVPSAGGEASEAPSPPALPASAGVPAASVLTGSVLSVAGLVAGLAVVDTLPVATPADARSSSLSYITLTDYHASLL